MSEAEEKAYCLNCEFQFHELNHNEKEFFCPNCGQSNLDSRLSFWRLIKDAISNIFDLDSRLIHTFRDLIYPSKLTRIYIEGRRKYYVNPARLFVFTLLALITIAIYSIKLENSNLGVDSFYAKAEQSKLMQQYSNLVDTLEIEGHESILDTIKSKLFLNVTELELDTLGKRGPEFFILGRQTKSFGISRYDAVHLTQKELFEKYNITNFWDKLNVGQYIRLTTNPVGGIKHIVKNLTWAVFITVLIISFLMKILYIRRNYYLVEHVVLILNSHSLLFVVGLTYLLVNSVVELGDKDGVFELVVFLISIALALIIQFITLKKYYQQGYIKTFVKQIIINSTYLLIFNLSVFAVALISLILY